MLAVQEERNNVVPYGVVEGKIKEKKTNKKDPKYKKDGTLKQVPNNNSEDRWVYPIKNKEDIKRILDYLHEQAQISNREDGKLAAYRNELLFAIGINVGLRVSDLITLKWENVFEDNMKTFRKVRGKKEKKTGKMKEICPNSCMQKYINQYLELTKIRPKKDDYIFITNRVDENGKPKHITDVVVEKMIKKATKGIGLEENYGTHSLRKTYAWHKYMMYVENKDPLALVKVQKDLNHRNSSDTARYLGIDRDEKIRSSMELGDYWEL